MNDPIEPDIGATEEEPEANIESKEFRPALTIVIQSWATPIAALIMLIVGLVGGYFLRPIVLPDRLMTTELVNPVLPTTAATTPGPDTEQIMQVVTQQTKHFIGNEAAKVTIIEFSDYQ